MKKVGLNLLTMKISLDYDLFGLDHLESDGGLETSRYLQEPLSKIGYSHFLFTPDANLEDRQTSAQFLGASFDESTTNHGA